MKTQLICVSSKQFENVNWLLYTLLSNMLSNASARYALLHFSQMGFPILLNMLGSNMLCHTSIRYWQYMLSYASASYDTLHCRSISLHMLGFDTLTFTALQLNTLVSDTLSTYV